MSKQTKEYAKKLVAQMTVEEKMSQMLYESPAIERLNIPAYNWWNEALHGVARAGVATVFPQSIGLAATFDPELVGQIGDVVSTEGRAKFNEFSRRGDHGIYKGLTFWAPNVNIFRDPRWGRGHETYGEDPYLTAELGCAYIKGLQGPDPDHLKSAACAKHFAVHSGPEAIRHEFNAKASKHDMYDTYLYAFKRCVKDAKVEAVMGAYNRVNGEPACGSKTLLQDMQEAYEKGLVSEEAITEAVERLMEVRIRLGMMKDYPSPYEDITYDKVECPEHVKLSVEAARRSLVLLKNENAFLPLDKNKIQTVAVIGPNANSRDALVGNYVGTSSRYITPLEGIQQYVGDDVRVLYAEGCHLYKDKVEFLAETKDRFKEAVIAAEQADVVVMCLGLDATIEGEEGDAGNEYASGDKLGLNLPGLQEELLETVTAVGKPVVLVISAGSALDLSWADAHVAAIIDSFYSGARGGKAVAEAIFGDFSPSGKLPVTFYQGTENLPEFTDYDMSDRTYRYTDKNVLYPFGYGLHYGTIRYENAQISCAQCSVRDAVDVSVDVINESSYTIHESVQAYIQHEEADAYEPGYQLKGIQTVTLQPKETKRVTISLKVRDFAIITQEGECVVRPGSYRIAIGGQQPDARSAKLTGSDVAALVVRREGVQTPVEY